LSDDKLITKENLDSLLRELAKEFRKLNGSKMPGEIILVGGASILANYGFRDTTTDIDAIIKASSAMKEAIIRVRDHHNLSVDWFNDDFKRTDSYSPKLIEVSKHYKTFSNVLEIRTITAEYLVAMKLRAGRSYKHDRSDIVGVLEEHAKRGSEIPKEKVERAFHELYGENAQIEESTKRWFDEYYKNKEYNYYARVNEQEQIAFKRLKDFGQKYPDVLKKENVNAVLEKLNDRESVLQKLNKAKDEISKRDDGHDKKRDDYTR